VLLTRVGSPSWRAAWFGVAGAIAFAFTAALIKEMNALISNNGWGHVFLDWPPYALAVTGLIGMFLAQNAFQAGPVTASQATLVIVDPLASIAIGIGLFGDHLQTAGGRAVGEVLSMIVLLAGVFSLSQSPLVVSVKSEDEEDHHMLSARQWRGAGGTTPDGDDTSADGPAGGASPISGEPVHRADGGPAGGRERRPDHEPRSAGERG
jgi:hypothetical protein